MTLKRRRFLQLAGAGALVSLSCPARAQAWPNRVVRLVVGFPPGGGMDSAARIVADRLSAIWGQSVIIENRPGAGGRIAHDAVAHAAADGYTMLISYGAPAVNRLLFAALTYDPVADFAPVSLVGTFPHVIVVPNTSPAADLRQFIAEAKANPGKISWASPGIGSTPHLAGELFKRVAGIEITHVPYRGVAAGAMTDLIAGRIDAMFNTTGSLLAPVRAHQVRGLAVTSAKRFPTAPELPTVAELGVPNYDVSSWYGLYVPARTPPDIVRRMNTDCAALLAEPAVKERFEPLGVVVASSSPDELAARNAADVETWAPIIKAADIRAE